MENDVGLKSKSLKLCRSNADKLCRPKFDFHVGISDGHRQGFECIQLYIDHEKSDFTT